MHSNVLQYILNQVTVSLLEILSPSIYKAEVGNMVKSRALSACSALEKQGSMKVTKEEGQGKANSAVPRGCNCDLQCKKKKLEIAPCPLH